MSSEDPIEADAELDAILRPERAIPRELGVDRAALWGRVAAAIPAVDLTVAPEPSAAVATAAVRAVAIKVGLAAFVGGMAAGVALDRTVSPRGAPPVASAPVASVEPSPALAPPLSSSPQPVAPSPPPAALASPAPMVERRPSPPSQRSTLAEERELIDVAAAAISGRELDAAKSALSRHRDRFPTGVLSEEREGLSLLLAITELGWGPAVESQYAAFARAFPKSPLLLSVNAARARALAKTSTDSSSSPQ